MSASDAPVLVDRMSPIKIVLSWIGVSLIAFPLAGYAGWGIAGHVDDVVPAVIGGAITGAGIGLVQWLFLRRDLRMSSMWIPATGVAFAIGLGVGSAVVDYGTGAGDLALMGLISGAPVGLSQGLLLRDRFSLWHVWMVATPVFFAIGWLVTQGFGIDVENQFTVFGAFGSIAFGLLAGLLLVAGKRENGGRSSQIAA